MTEFQQNSVLSKLYFPMKEDIGWKTICLVPILPEIIALVYK